jgi:K+-sensing histidine kinase KdpD
LLRALVGELVDNAFKFSDAGTPVRVCGSMSAHEYVFSVSDQGRGISASQIQDISAYRQFDRDRYEQQGLGLGLALCQRICDVTGGRMEYESAPDAGTTVRVTMPGDPGKPVADVRTTAKHSG